MGIFKIRGPHIFSFQGAWKIPWEPSGPYNLTPNFEDIVRISDVPAMDLTAHREDNVAQFAADARMRLVPAIACLMASTMLSRQIQQKSGYGGLLRLGAGSLVGGPTEAWETDGDSKRF